MFEGKKILITAGPTYEPIDPVRFIGNRSSGKMGYHIAEALAAKNANVILISGPVSIMTHNQKIKLIKVETAEEMYQAAISEFNDTDIAILSAAVADFTPVEVNHEKIKKKDLEGDEIILKLKKTKDILASLGQVKRDNQLLVGFSLETHDETENARLKLDKKNCDVIVLNSLNDQGAGFGYDTNKISILSKKLGMVNFQLKPKEDVATDILNFIQHYLELL